MKFFILLGLTLIAAPARSNALTVQQQVVAKFIELQKSGADAVLTTEMKDLETEGLVPGDYSQTQVIPLEFETGAPGRWTKYLVATIYDDSTAIAEGGVLANPKGRSIGAIYRALSNGKAIRFVRVVSAKEIKELLAK